MPRNTDTARRLWVLYAGRRPQADEEFRTYVLVIGVVTLLLSTVAASIGTIGPTKTTRPTPIPRPCS